MESHTSIPRNSLLVPSVQELAKNELVSVPSRYIRPDEEPRVVINDGNQLPQIPVIDMQRLLDQATDGSELSQLRFALKEWGFFQLINHGVSSSLLDNLKLQVQDFFNLPMEEKKKFWQYPGEVEGFGQAFVVSEEQKLNWGDIFYMMTQPAHLRKPHLFPNLPLPFRETLDTYSSEVQNLAVFIVQQIAKTLNIDPEEMRHHVEGLRQSIRMNYYPPCPQPDEVIGLAVHTDAAVLTILLQINEMEGLQIKKDGRWIPVNPLPNAFVVNIGDMMEIITNGAYRSIEHRATINSMKERISVAAFHAARYGEIGPARSLVSERKPALFRRMSLEEYYKGVFSRDLRGKCYLDTLRVQHGEEQG